MSLGKIYGRTSTNAFKFKVEGNVKKWDYIKVNHPEVGSVLGQVNEIESSQSQSSATCSIIGYRTERGFLRKPRTPLPISADIFPAEDNFIRVILGLRNTGLYLGLLEGKDKLKAFLDPKKLITKHLAVLAKSGSGKSYASAVILEELAKLGIPVVIVDPHGEYASIRNPNTHPEDIKYLKLYGIQSEGFARQTKEFAINTYINTDAEQIKLPIPQNSFDIVETIPFKVSAAQKGLLYNIINDLQEKKGKFGFEDMIRELEFSDSNAKWRLIGGFQNLIKTGLFSFSPTKQSEIVKQGQISIINLKGAPTELQEIALRALLAELFEQRKVESIPPFFLIIEEAHNYCPERGFGEARSSGILRSIASEGRKFGLGMCVITQRPSRVDKSVLSQCTSQIALQVTNPNDLSAISKSFEGITRETEIEIKNLPIGKALVIGASDYPIFVDIRVRRSEHGGRAKTFEMIKSELKSEKPKTAYEQVKDSGNIIYLFEPRITKKDIESMEHSKVLSISLILRPCLSLNCIKQNIPFHLVFDLLSNFIFTLDSKLNIVKVPSPNANLSLSQRNVLGIVSNKEGINASEIFVKAGLGFSELNSIINLLINKKYLAAKGKNIFLGPMGKIFNINKLNFLDKPKIVSSPNATKLQPQINEDKIIKLLNRFGIQIINKKLAFMPFYKIRTAEEEKIIDALSYNLKI